MADQRWNMLLSARRNRDDTEKKGEATIKRRKNRKRTIARKRLFLRFSVLATSCFRTMLFDLHLGVSGCWRET